MKRRTLLLGLGLLALASAACSSKTSGGSSGGSASPTTSNPTAAATSAYVTAYNTMINAENPDITNQNSNDPTTSAAGINGRVQVRQTFDAALKTIQFPASAQADAQKVLSADAALESALGQLAANVGDISNYNSIFATVNTEESAFAAADAALSSDLGVTSVTTTTG